MKNAKEPAKIDIKPDIETLTKNDVNITITVSKNGTIRARYYNGTEGFKSNSHTVENIDKKSLVLHLLKNMVYRIEQIIK